MKPKREESKGFDLAAIFGGDKSKKKDPESVEEPAEDYDAESGKEEVRTHLEKFMGEVDDEGVDAFISACKAAQDC